jgi:XTP/dITP diphosphohydrolase
MLSRAVSRNSVCLKYPLFPAPPGNSSLTNHAPIHRITLVIATRNPGKLREIIALLQDLDVLLVPLDRVGLCLVPPEGGQSFQENARRKAEAVARATGCLTVADDSGLEVDALGGRPGVLSARFGGPQATDADRNRLLLESLHHISIERRTARFRCVVAIAEPHGRVQLAEGTCEGRIALAPRGTNGFGYDPVFELPSLGRTLAEVPTAMKNRMSHRAQALARAREILRGVLADRG